MSYAEIPDKSQADQILENQEEILNRLSVLTDAVNSVGALQQWMVDNVKGIFEMFGNPQMMAVMGQMAGGMMPPDLTQGAHNAGSANPK